MLNFDAHFDLTLNGVDWNRDLRQSVHDIRAQEIQLGMSELGRGTGTVTLPELRKAGVGLGVATLCTRLESAINHPSPVPPLSSWRAAVGSS